MDWVSTWNFSYKVQARECWHFWFAWYPVVVKRYPDGATKKVWFKILLRKGKYRCSYADCSWEYEYKEVTEDGRL